MTRYGCIRIFRIGNRSHGRRIGGIRHGGRGSTGTGTGTTSSNGGAGIVQIGKLGQCYQSQMPIGEMIVG